MVGGHRLALGERDGVHQRRRPEGVLPHGGDVQLSEHVVVDQTGAADQDLGVIVLGGRRLGEEHRRNGVAEVHERGHVVVLHLGDRRRLLGLGRGDVGLVGVRLGPVRR